MPELPKTMAFYGATSLTGSMPHSAIIARQKPGKWTVRWININYTPEAGHEPSWLARKFTSWVLGMKWTRT